MPFGAVSCTCNQLHQRCSFVNGRELFNNGGSEIQLGHQRAGISSDHDFDAVIFSVTGKTY